MDRLSEEEMGVVNHALSHVSVYHNRTYPKLETRMASTLLVIAAGRVDDPVTTATETFREVLRLAIACCDCPWDRKL